MRKLLFTAMLFFIFTGLAFGGGVDSQTVLMLHMEQGDATTTVDDSPSNHTVNINTAQLSDAQSKFGNSSAHFAGAGSSYLSINQASADFDFGDGEFTVDFWVYPTQGGKNEFIVGYTINTSAGPWLFGRGHNGNLLICMKDQPNVGVWEYVVYTNLPLPLNTWSHVAVSRSGTNVYPFVDGKLGTLIEDVGTLNTSLTSRFLKIGTYGNGEHFAGYVDELRISKGTARWTAPFDPPTEAYDPETLSVSLSAAPAGGSAPLATNFTASVDNGVPPYTYAWDFGDGSTEEAENPSHTYTDEGTYTAEVTVTDGEGNTATADITVTATSLPLSVTAAASPEAGALPLDVNFSASVNGGTAPYEYSWDFGDSHAGNGASPSHTYTTEGPHTAEVTVTDAEGNTATAAIDITTVSGECAEHALYDSDTRLLTIPYLDVPLLNPITQEASGEYAVFECVLKLAEDGVGSFTVNGLTYLEGPVSDPCHGTYTYDGKLFIPNVDVTSVIILPPDIVVPGPVDTFELTLRQLPISTSVFQLENAVLKP